MPVKRRKRKEDNASPDLTPMIDVTFQLLIFFILCTRFRHIEQFFETDLPKDQGIRQDPSPPKEQLTIYCQWDAATQANSYVIALDARGRRPVEGSFARIDELVTFASDTDATAAQKRARYLDVQGRLVKALEKYRIESGAKIEKIEISFAVNAVEGARSGTAPWVFVTLAIDATSSINKRRADNGEKPLPVSFKFADALGTYGR